MDKKTITEALKHCADETSNHCIKCPLKGFNSLVFDWNGLQMLTPYTEDSAYAHGYTEAESKYREIRDELEKQAYQRGYETAKHECEANIQSNRDEAYNKGHNDGFKFGYEKLKDLEHERVEKAYQRGYEGAYDTAYADAEEIYESGKRAMYQKGLKDAWEAARKIVDLWRDIPNDELMKIFDVRGNWGESVLSLIMRCLPPSEAIEKIRQYEQEKEMDGLRQNIQTIVDQCGYTIDEITEVLQKMKESDNG